MAAGRLGRVLGFACTPPKTNMDTQKNRHIWKEIHQKKTSVFVSMLDFEGGGGVRCLEKVKHILPNGGSLIVIYQHRIRKINHHQNKSKYQLLPSDPDWWPKWRSQKSPLKWSQPQIRLPPWWVDILHTHSTTVCEKMTISTFNKNRFTWTIRRKIGLHTWDSKIGETSWDWNIQIYCSWEDILGQQNNLWTLCWCYYTLF